MGSVKGMLACLADAANDAVLQQVKIAGMEHQAHQMTALTGAAAATASQTWQKQLQCCSLQAASWTSLPVRMAVMNAGGTTASLQSITYLRSGITVCLSIVSVLERTLRAAFCIQSSRGLMLGECLGGRLMHC